MTSRSGAGRIEDVKEASAMLADLFALNGRVVVLTGAGLSTESGIPDYRSPGGIWSTHAPIQYQAFVTDKAARLEDWRRRFQFHAEFTAAAPNAAHRALARLTGEGRIGLVVTQNIDGLHQRAGQAAGTLIELHGNGTYAHCLDCRHPAGIPAQQEAVAAGRSPRCAACGGLLKAAVVSFGEAMPQDKLARAVAAARQADVFLVLGSSLAVHPAATLPELAVAAGADLVIVNRDPTPLDHLASCLMATPLAATFAAFSGES
ncbi:NAD-dependent deacetylase [Microvirga tunisiensis]|uniref:protein acetyllysine N-acetyltransferase n=1 Tax=Pannonibacter tanglangensis TaxID=2750084 RepID=A0A7X5F1L3_9HYPH|nr:Sir2 family NAD-dependent protein deacetylase [Pannonibacter sp. XCT-53]NBN78098.1 NAD-dependent deacetylase [Pannonibacter sp. XCT-53]